MATDAALFIHSATPDSETADKVLYGALGAAAATLLLAPSKALYNAADSC